MHSRANAYSFAGWGAGGGRQCEWKEKWLSTIRMLKKFAWVGGLAAWHANNSNNIE